MVLSLTLGFLGRFFGRFKERKSLVSSSFPHFMELELSRVIKVSPGPGVVNRGPNKPVSIPH
jgi:hypothetical protein